jgi:ribosomal protein S18 acetylase RimI-like enzyme
MKIRRYQKSDETAVVSLWQACNLVVPANNPYIDIARKTAFQADLFFVAVIDGLVVGTIMAGYEGHRGWLNYMAVDPGQRKRGIGTDLVRHATTEMQKLGCQKINLQVRESNVDVLVFYETLGFKRDNVVSLGLRLPQGERS